MSANNIITSLQKLTGFTEQELHAILPYFDSIKIQKKTTILQAGKIANEVYFIIQGCMRLFYEKDGLDISAYFFTENMFAGAYDSFIAQQQSKHAIETVEECHVLVISYKAFHTLLSTFPKMNEFVRKILEERFVALHELFTAHILESPEERYLALQKERPDLLNRIPQHQIATFLGVTPVSLSRIRNRVMKK
jgi:CRP-like cAMP-binding protein